MRGPPRTTGSVADYSDAILSWWRDNGTAFPLPRLGTCGARRLRNLAQLSLCERVFSLLKNLFGEEQISALADYIQAALMLNYNGRQVG